METLVAVDEESKEAEDDEVERTELVNPRPPELTTDEHQQIEDSSEPLQGS
jgi:hypothetical protein